MDEDLAGGSTAAAGSTPAAQPVHGAGQPVADWNTSLAAPAAPAPEFAGRAASTGRGSGPAGERSTDEGRVPSKRRPAAKPVWQDPADLPAVQHVLAGAFGAKLAVLADAAATVQTVMASIDVDGLSDAEVIALTQAVERAGRPVDAARVRTAAVVGYRSRTGLGNESLAWRMGASHQADLLTRLTLTSAAEMKRRVVLGEKVAPRMLGGAVLAPVFPVVAAALTAGELGVDSATEIVKALADYKVHGRFDADRDQVDRAEADLVERATGTVYGPRPDTTDAHTTDTDTDTHIDTDTDSQVGADGVVTGPIVRLRPSDGFTHPAEDLRSMGVRWRAWLNPDGAAPTEDVLEAKSTFSFGTLRDGLYPIRGAVTPELKGIMTKTFDTYLSARSAPAFPSAEEQQRLEAGELIPGTALDDRTGGEKRADILRGILTHVAGDPHTPTMGGTPPTVMVHVNATDLLANAGVGWIDGVDGPISMRTINQLIDNGGLQPVFFTSTGAILGLGSKERCFTPLQRKAITARDGGCIIPGCDSPAHWAEIHHVIPWRHGGKTHVDNGVLLCWYHHHTIDTSGWNIRMVNGTPQVRAPHWIDPERRWRTPERHHAHHRPDRKEPGSP
jgi:hypothetical protein